MPTTDRNYMNVLWGKLASEILMQDWDNALDDLNRLKEVLDSNVSVFSTTDLCRFNFHIISCNTQCTYNCMVSIWSYDIK